MLALGFRAESDVVHFAVVKGPQSAPELVDSGKFSAPRSFDTAAALAHVRARIQNMIEQHKPDAVGVRFSETFFPRKLSRGILDSLFARARIEGVILEVSQASGVTVVQGGAMQQISSELGSKRAKGYLETGEFRGVDLSSKPTHVQEAILIAASLLE
jgi:hypothetical protein